MSWGIASGWKAREGTSLSLFFRGGGKEGELLYKEPGKRVGLA